MPLSTCRSRLTLTEPFLRATHERLWSRPVAYVDVPAARLRGAGGSSEWIAPAPEPGDARLRVRLFPDALRAATWRFWRLLAPDRTEPPRVELALFHGRGCAGAVLMDGAAQPLDEVWIQGPRMECWRPGEAVADMHGAVPADGRFSRYAGALGGDAVHARLRALSIAVVGVSRLGSLLAVAAAKAGVASIALVDPDVVEDHHLDAIEALGPRALGTPKVIAVQRLLQRIAPDTAVHAVPAGIEDPAALAAVLGARVIVTAPDRGQPRLIAALAAAAGHRVHLDVGTAVLRDDLPGDDRELLAGADVRLMLPGDGCLLCAGGLDLDRRDASDWRRERAGSLRSLNGLAVSLGWTLLERLITGDRTRSAWSRILLARDGTLRCEEPRFRRRDACSLCDLAGAGEAALAAPDPFVAP